MQKINNKIDISNNAILIIKEIEWYYKTLSLKNYSEIDIQKNFIYYKFSDIKQVSIGDQNLIIFLDVIIVFWIRSLLLRRYDILFDEKEIDEIVSKIGCFNFLKGKNDVQINYDGYLIKEFLPFLIFISKEIIFKGMLINRIEYTNPPLPDFIVEFNYRNNLYLKPIEITTLSNYSNYDSDWPNLSEKTKKEIYNNLLEKFNKKSNYELAINKEYKNEKHILLPVTVVATSIYSFISRDRLIKILDWITLKSVDNPDFLEFLKVNEKKYDIISNNSYFYFLYFLFPNNSESINQKKEWCIYEERFINLVIKKWKVNVEKYDLEELVFHINDKEYIILLKNYEYQYRLKKGNELYNNLMKILEYSVDDEWNIVYKKHNINKLQANMWVELYVTERYKDKLDIPKVFGPFKYKG